MGTENHKLKVKSFSVADRQRLARWLNTKHLDDSSIAAQRAALLNGPRPVLIMDDWLNADVFDGLYNGLVNVIDVRPKYRLSREQHEVDEKDWRQADQDKRLYHHLGGLGCLPGQEMSPMYLRQIAWLALLKSSAMHQYLARIFDLQVNDVEVLIKAADPNEDHHLSWHDDCWPGRQVCCVVYMNPRWVAERGGELQWRTEEGVISSIEPLPNRAVFFVPDPDHAHQVTPLNAAFSSELRWTYSIWFKR